MHGKVLLYEPLCHKELRRSERVLYVIRLLAPRRQLLGPFRDLEVENPWTRLVLDSYTALASQAQPSQDWLPGLGSPAQGPITFKLLCGADLLGELARTSPPL